MNYKYSITGERENGTNIIFIKTNDDNTVPATYEIVNMTNTKIAVVVDPISKQNKYSIDINDVIDNYDEHSSNDKSNGEIKNTNSNVKDFIKPKLLRGEKVKEFPYKEVIHCKNDDGIYAIYTDENGKEVFGLISSDKDIPLKDTTNAHMLKQHNGTITFIDNDSLIVYFVNKYHSTYGPYNILEIKSDQVHNTLTTYSILDEVFYICWFCNLTKTSYITMKCRVNRNISGNYTCDLTINTPGKIIWLTKGCCYVSDLQEAKKLIIHKKLGVDEHIHYDEYRVINTDTEEKIIVKADGKTRVISVKDNEEVKDIVMYKNRVRVPYIIIDKLSGCDFHCFKDIILVKDTY